MLFGNLVHACINMHILKKVQFVEIQKWGGRTGVTAKVGCPLWSLVVALQVFSKQSRTDTRCVSPDS